ncbi:MAG: hypothetical protein AB1480_15970 [Nitrospirota bacterium]
MPNHIENLIASAYNLRISYGDLLLQDSKLHTLLQRLNKTISATINEMESVGVVKECADCAVHGEGTCCGIRTGYKCDRILILLNLLLDVSPVIQTRHPHLCPFLTEQGCSLRARPVICVNFICQRLRRNITHEGLVRLQEIAGEELDALFNAEEYVKKKIASISL